MQAVQDTLYDAFGQRQISTIFSQSNQYRVILEANPEWQADPAIAAAVAGAGDERGELGRPSDQRQRDGRSRRTM